MQETGGVAAGVGAAGRVRALRAPLDPAQMALLLALFGLLTAFILYPLIPGGILRRGLSAPAPSRAPLSSTRFSSGAGSRSG